MKVLKVIERVTEKNLDEVKFVKHLKNKKISYVGCSKLTGREFKDWALSKGYYIKEMSTNLDRIKILNKMINQGVYMFGDDIYEVEEKYLSKK